jgi:hypothetical protein
MLVPALHKSVGITLAIFYQGNSILITFLKLIHIFIHVFKLITVTFQIFLSSFPGKSTCLRPVTF